MFLSVLNFFAIFLYYIFFFFFFKQKTAYEMLRSLVGSGDLIPHATSNLVLQPVDSVIVSMKVLLPQYDVRPGEVVDFGFPLYVYELKDRGSTDTFSVHIVGADTIAVQSGFYAPEVSKARWTAGSTAFHAPLLGGKVRCAPVPAAVVGQVKRRGSGCPVGLAHLRRVEAALD